MQPSNDKHAGDPRSRRLSCDDEKVTHSKAAGRKQRLRGRNLTPRIRSSLSVIIANAAATVLCLLALSSCRCLDALEDLLHAVDARDILPGIVIAAALTLRQP
jgi:hypothetical protein